MVLFSKDSLDVSEKVNAGCKRLELFQHWVNVYTFLCLDHTPEPSAELVQAPGA